MTDATCGTCGAPVFDDSCVICTREAAYASAIAALKAPKGAYKVLLASVGNPDFGQDNRRSLPGVPRRTLRVASIADASKACRAYIAHYELGGGNWLGGEVTKDGVVVAKISYNGRAWEPGPWPTKEIYRASEIRIDRNSVTIVLPTFYAFGIDLVYLFDHTTMAWSRPSIGATIVNGEPRVTIDITLVATWTDEMNAKWRRDGNDRRQVLVELYEEDVRKILGVIATYDDKFGPGVDGIRDRLELALVPLP